jgi:uncharacterized protein (DUF433 family)
LEGVLLTNFEDYIVINPDIRSGKPCIKGTRITVYDILEYFAGGMSEQEILDDFPSLSHKDIQMVFAFAAARERRLAISLAA